MSSNSRPRILATAPMVSAFRVEGCEARSDVEASMCLLLQVAELVFADLDLVAVLERLGLDPAAVDVGAVERSEVVDVEAVVASDEQGVVARDGDVVEEDARVGRAPDRGAIAVKCEALPRPAATGADH